MIFSDVDEATLFRNPILQPPPDNYSTLSRLLSAALVGARAVAPSPVLPKTLEDLLEASKGVRGAHRGDVLGRQVVDHLGKVPGLVLDPGIARAVTRKTIEGVP